MEHSISRRGILLATGSGFFGLLAGCMNYKETQTQLTIPSDQTVSVASPDSYTSIRWETNGRLRFEGVNRLRLEADNE